MNASGQPFEPIRPNPYIVGNPVRDPKMFFGRVEDFELVRRRFTDLNRGALLVFSGERRSGKTSILFQIVEGRLGEDFVPVLIDMQSMAVDNEVAFLGRIAEQIVESLAEQGRPTEGPKFDGSSSPSDRFRKFIEGLLRQYAPKKLLLLFDEYELLESKIDSGVLSDDVLYILANLLENYPVFLIFTGSQHLEGRHKKYWRILGASEYRSISYLQRKDAVRLITEPVEGRVDYADGVVDRICELTAGQPFYSQAVCQGIVDALNEHRTRQASFEILDRVVERILENPFPQMHFIWHRLEDDGKLCIAALAQVLPEAKDQATVDDIVRHLKDEDYPLDLPKSRIATAMESLLESELLIKSSGTDPGYSLRMDLWRLWIQQMHSVWQVMLELGMEAEPRPKGRKRAWIVGVVSLALVAILGWRFLAPDSQPDPVLGLPVSTITPALLSVTAEPAGSSILLDGNLVGREMFTDQLAPGREYLLLIQREGYVDSTLRFTPAEGETLSPRIALQPSLGGLEIRTDPSGATVFVDGKPQGKSPVIVSGLEVPVSHAIRVEMANFQPRMAQVEVRADTVISETISMRSVQASFIIRTTPSDATVTVDGTLIGSSPVSTVQNVGDHRVQLALDGHVPVDTLLAVTEQTSRIDIPLGRLPQGTLIVRGNVVGLMYVNDTVVGNYLNTSGPQQLDPGAYSVHVILNSGAEVDTTIQVLSGEAVTFDYVTRVITRSGKEGQQ